jgi:hypothetical protein
MEHYAKEHEAANAELDAVAVAADKTKAAGVKAQMKLKKSIRFTDASRQILAERVAISTMNERKAGLEHTHDYLMEMFGQTIGSVGMSMEPGYHSSILYPYMRFVPLIVNDRLHSFDLGEEYPVPFALHTDANAFYQEYCLEMHELMEEYVADYAAYSLARDGSAGKLYKFLQGFTSPAKLLLQAPDFGSYFPEEWMEECTDPAPTTIDEVLHAA